MCVCARSITNPAPSIDRDSGYAQHTAAVVFSEVEWKLEGNTQFSPGRGRNGAVVEVISLTQERAESQRNQVEESDGDLCLSWVVLVMFLHINGCSVLMHTCTTLFVRCATLIENTVLLLHTGVMDTRVRGIKTEQSLRFFHSILLLQFQPVSRFTILCQVCFLLLFFCLVCILLYLFPLLLPFFLSIAS